MAKKNYYVTKVGRIPGIYKTWAKCEKQVKGFSGAIYQGFSTLEQAQEYMEGKVQTKMTSEASGTIAKKVEVKKEIQTPSKHDIYDEVPF